MASDELYSLALEYKKTKLWKKLYDSELFSLQLSSGETAYCCVMGDLGEHIALAVYVGGQGFQSLRPLLFQPGDDANPMWALGQACVQCAFENKDELSEEELAEARAYGERHGVAFRGRKSFPQFVKYSPNRLPWRLREPEDEAVLKEALTAAMALAEMLKAKSKRDLGLSMVEEDTTDLPLLTREGEGWVLSRTPVPPELPPAYPTPNPPEADTLRQLKQLKKGGIVECEILRLMNPIQETPDEAPYFPVLVLCVDSKSKQVLHTEPVLRYDTEPDSALRTFVDALVQWGKLPKAVKVRTEATRALLEGLCSAAGILLSTGSQLPALDDARESLFSFLSDEDDDEDFEDFDPEEISEEDISSMMAQSAALMMFLSDDNLRSLPPETVGQLMELVRLGVLPPEMSRRLRRIFPMQ